MLNFGMVCGPRFNRKSFLLCFLLGMALMSPVSASESPTPDQIVIDADRFEVIGQSNDVLAQGNVQVVQGRVRVQGAEATYRQADQIVYMRGQVELFNEGIVLRAPQVDVYGNQRLIHASGGVEFTLNDLKGQSEMIDFDMLAQTMTLTGEPHASQGKDEVQGTVIKVLLQEKRIVAEGKTRIILSPETVKGR